MEERRKKKKETGVSHSFFSFLPQISTYTVLLKQTVSVYISSSDGRGHTQECRCPRAAIAKTLTRCTPIKIFIRIKLCTFEKQLTLRWFLHRSPKQQEGGKKKVSNSHLERQKGARQLAGDCAKSQLGKRSLGPLLLSVITCRTLDLQVLIYILLCFCHQTTHQA